MIGVEVSVKFIMRRGLAVSFKVQTTGVNDSKVILS
jgi:hypothetical protein